MSLHIRCEAGGAFGEVSFDRDTHHMGMEPQSQTADFFASLLEEYAETLRRMYPKPGKPLHRVLFKSDITAATGRTGFWAVCDCGWSSDTQFSTEAQSVAAGRRHMNEVTE